jgi:transposase
MKEIKTLAIDLAKYVFQLHGMDEQGHVVLQKRVRRAQLSTVLVQLPPCEIVMEACAGSHYWARQVRSFGHQARLLPAQYVKPYSRRQKNDRNDAEAIACAASQPRMPQVPIKSEEQQAVMALHRIRARLMKERIGLTNQLHGLAGEFGLVLPLGLVPLRRELTKVMDEGRLPALLQQAFTDQLEHLSEIEQRLKALTTQIEVLAQASEPCQRLMRHRGVGPITASAFAAEVADPAVFKNGRQVGAWLGLVPRQHSSADRTQLLGITKRGNPYLRQLLIHGARSALFRAARHPDALSRWSMAVKERRGSNRAAVALANKTARHLWATLRYPQAA